jgi:hypothetical protein
MKMCIPRKVNDLTTKTKRAPLYSGALIFNGCDGDNVRSRRTPRPRFPVLLIFAHSSMWKHGFEYFFLRSSRQILRLQNTAALPH